MLHQVVDSNEHIKRAACFPQIVLEDSNAFDGQIHDLLKGLEIIGEGSELIEFVRGDDFLLRVDDIVNDSAGGGALVCQNVFGGVPDG